MKIFSEQNKNIKKIIAITAVIIAISAAAVVFFAVYLPGTYTSHTGFAMGSTLELNVYGNSDGVSDTVFSRITVLEVDKISRNAEHSEIYRLNENGSLKLSDETLSYVKKAIEISERSGGAFDISVGSLSALWNFDESADTVPSEEKINELLAYCGYEKISIDGNTVTLAENMALDTGAMGKGIACDKALEVFEEKDVSKALLSVGGTVLTYSDDETHWTIGIKTPETDDFSSFMKIDLTGTNFISTSGKYEKFFEKDGKYYHHILSPETGHPADSGLKSVTVISDEGLVSDALSTACFVLGTEDSASLLEFYGAQAVFVTDENIAYVTDGIIDGCEILNDAYRIMPYE